MCIRNCNDRISDFEDPSVCVCSVMSDYSQPHGRSPCQASLFMKFSREEYWSRLPFPSPGIFLIQGLNPSPTLADGFFTTLPPGKHLEDTRIPSSLFFITGLLGAFHGHRSFCLITLWRTLFNSNSETKFQREPNITLVVISLRQQRSACVL